MEFSIKKQFKSYGFAKHMRKISAGEEDISHEELPILLDHNHRHHTQPMTGVGLSDRREVIVKINEGADSSASTSDLAKNGRKIWWQASSEGEELVEIEIMEVRGLNFGSDMWEIGFGLGD
ncbi:hypothetical protein FF1_023454 [Malus domestica]